MIYWIFLGGLTLIFTASIIISGLAYKKQQAISTRKSNVRHIKRMIDEYSDILATLLKTDEKYELIILLQHQICNFYAKLVTIDIENPSTLNRLENEKSRLQLYQANKRETPASTALTSDTEIETANIHINTLTKFTSTSYKNGKIGQAKYKDLIHHLQLLKLHIEVDSHSLQAQKYLESNDRVLAQSHLKQAKEALRNSPLEYPEKNQKTRDLTDKIKQVMRSPTNYDENEKAETTIEKPPADDTKKKNF